MKNMNKAQTRIDDEVQKTLECFERFEEVECGPEFLTRLEGRIRSLERPFLFRKVPLFQAGYLRAVFLVAVVFLNLAFSFLAFRGVGTRQDSRTDYLSVFADYYNMDTEDAEILLSSDQR